MLFLPFPIEHFARASYVSESHLLGHNDPGAEAVAIFVWGPFPDRSYPGLTGLWPMIDGDNVRSSKSRKDIEKMEYVNAIWIGETLHPLYAKCISSFLDFGYKVRLHSYSRLEAVPAGVELFDASQLMSADEIVRHRRTKSLALASDIYRYRLMQRGMGIYVDCDVLCRAPLPTTEYLFGWESDILIGSAVLRFPPESPALAEMVRAANDPQFIPWWYKKSKRRYLAIRKAIGIGVAVADQSWGAIGPKLVTEIVRKHGLIDHAQPIDVLYPLHPWHSSLLYEPGLRVDDFCTPRTATIHLWNSHLLLEKLRPGTALGELLKLS